MSYASELLAQAKHLAGKERMRPKQASLRRAVSAAYYALFHFLTAEAAAAMVKGQGATALRPVLQRAFVHRQMKQAAQIFAGERMPDRWMRLTQGRGEVPEDLRLVAAAFVELQEARHEADYDITRRFSRSQARELIEVSEKAMGAWRGTRNTAQGRAFLMALLIHNRLRGS